MDEYFYLGLAIAAVAALGLVYVGLRQPLWFYYFALAGTAVLKTPELPIVREKVSIVEIFLLLLWGTWGILVKGRVRRTVSTEVIRWGLAFCVACLVSSFVAIGTAPSHLQNFKMTAYSLLEAANYCYGVAIIWTTLQVLDSWERWVGAILAWIAGMAIASIVGAAAVAGVAPGWAFEETGRICSTLKNENQVPSMILPILLACLLSAAREGIGLLPRIAFLGLCAAAVLTAVGTGSRTAALMLIVAAIGGYLILTQGLGARGRVRLLMLTNLAVAFSAAIVAYFFVAWAMYDGKYSLVRTPSWQRPAVMLIEWFQGERSLDETRPRQIQAAMEYFWTSPILGTGPKFGGHFAATNGEVHNTYFSLMLETGLFGACTFLAMLLLAFYRGHQACQKCAYPWFALLGRTLLLGFLLLCLYNATMLGLRQRNIWFMLGMIFAFCDLVAAGVVPLNRPMPKVLRSIQALFMDSPNRPLWWRPARRSANPALPRVIR